jgi:hypothetical protein
MQGGCVRCANCPKQNAIDHLCTFCLKNRNVHTRAKLVKDASILKTMSKKVTSATENTFMPLLQMVFVFPIVIQLFPNDNDNDNDNEWITFVRTNWRFIFTVVSISFSLISMGMAHTENYYARPGKAQHKTFMRWLVMFLSVMFQMVTRVLAIGKGS